MIIQDCQLHGAITYSITFIAQVYKDRNLVAQLVRRAERAGFKAIALTVDTPILGRREADIKNRLAFISKFQRENI